MKPWIRSKYTPTLLLLGCLGFHATSFALDGRLTVRGLGGAGTYGDLDALLPLYQGCQSLFFTDLQAKYNDDDSYFAGLALGYRALSGNQIYGANLFVDDTRSSHHHQYWVISPGLETIHCGWDLRLNGYIPVKRHHDEDNFFLSGDDCGNPGDCSFVEFKGHQQFEHQFAHFEEIGAGADLIGGINLPRLNCAQLHAGVYYYHFNEERIVWSDDDHKNLVGIGARFDLPLTANWSLTSEASYDHQEHAAVAVGLKFQVGHTPKLGCCPTLCDRLYDPLYRHIGPIRAGTGVPVRRATKDEGLFLRRDDIWFFSDTGVATNADATGGTFENPFADDQLSQTTIDGIGTDANLYFNTGTYVISGAGTPPNARITLEDGQSLFGRTTNFACAATGDERPILLGRIDINGTDSHRIASLQLLNENLIGGNTIALFVNGGQVDICNSIIQASVSRQENDSLQQAIAISVAGGGDVIVNNSLINAIAVAGNSTASNGALSFLVVNSEVSMFDSTVNSLARIDGNNTNVNQVFNVFLNNSQVTIVDTVLNATGHVQGNNERNQVFGIIDTSSNFSQVSINNATFNVLAEVDGNNLNLNLAFGIDDRSSNGLGLSMSDATFNVAAQVKGDNQATNQALAVNDSGQVSITNSIFNVLARVDGQSSNNQALGLVANDNAVFAVSDSLIDVLAQVDGSNTGSNLAIGLQANPPSLIAIFDSLVKVTADANGSNIALGKDGNVQDFNTVFNVTP